MILDKVGVITDEVSADLIEALDWTAEQGLKHVEIRMVDGNNVIGLNDDQIQKNSGRSGETRTVCLGSCLTVI
ncbi:hypothetical protein O9H85_00105 [Paenibacillus filicis]|uniref:Uncharacterized protein n=1 Tax=Paenibacillus gyeongsangnamensis TaxID=3388067 RepID=A0ABT4Q1W3_9BACL|nr:hypothetical protein [Paenibacillus filicis]MCZ8510866.1 hypothetical protein [Paenibacillus filicis]